MVYQTLGKERSKEFEVCIIEVYNKFDFFPMDISNYIKLGKYFFFLSSLFHFIFSIVLRYYDFSQKQYQNFHFLYIFNTNLINFKKKYFIFKTEKLFFFFFFFKLQVKQNKNFFIFATEVGIFFNPSSSIIKGENHQ